MPKKIQQPATMSISFTRDQIDLIKQTVAKGATDAELQLFLYACKKTGLDPLTKQIHAIKRWDSAAGRETMAIQTGIDGYRLIADRTGQLAGIDDPVFDREDADHPNRATVTVYKFINGEKCEFPATARWLEYVATKKDGAPMALWKKMPYLMLGKCAEALALRKAFPADLSGLYTFEEDASAAVDTAVEVASPVIPPKQISGGSAAPSGEQRTATESPVRPFAGETAAPKPTRKTSPQLKLKVVSPVGESETKPEPLPRPNQDEIVRRLEETQQFTRGDFMAIACKNQWLGKGKDWPSMDSVPDEMYQVFLPDDEWNIVLSELAAMRKSGQ